MESTLASVRNQRGVALLMAVLVLMVMSMLGAILMSTLRSETKISGHSVREAQALNIAEAGVAEGVARLRTGEVPNNMNPRMVAQIFNTVPGSVPVLGTDSLGLATAQPSGAWLDYTTPGRGPDALTVEYKTDPGKTVIYKYDPSANPAVQTTSGQPIFLITSTGHQGRDVRHVQTEVTARPFNLNVKGALAGDNDIRFIGNAVVCGYNHSADILYPAGENGRLGSNNCQPWETGTGDLPGSWTTGTTTNGGTAYQDGFPVKNLSGQTGFYAGPWQALGMTQAEFFAWVGAPSSTESSPANGIIYLDNNGVTQDQSGSFAYHGATGEGFLYVDGDLTINSTFTYRGLIYVEGDLKMNGQAWVLGGIIVKGKGEIRQNGGATILYSSDTIQQVLSKYGGKYVQLAWKEL